MEVTNARPPITVASSATLRPMFENGSGDVFATRRVPAFNPWVVSAMLPASNATMTSKTGFVRPKVCKASNAPPMDE